MHKIKNIFLISICSFLIISCATARNDCPLVGKWRSNKQATLEQMEEYGNVREEQRNIFLNIFGRLTLEYTCSEMSSYYDESLVAKDTKYEIIKREGNVFQIIYHLPELYGGVTERRITLVGECYYVPLNLFPFSEVFCRVK